MCNPTKEKSVQEALGRIHAIKEHLLEIEQILLSTLYSEKEATDTNDFLEKLTENEKIAFKALYNESTQNNGIVSISKLVEETQLSRPVYQNVVQKMKHWNIAIVANKGVKGTHIQFLIDFYN